MHILAADDPIPLVVKMQFGGFAISPVVGCMAKDFVAQLKADGRPIVEGAFIVASYDPVRMMSGATNCAYNFCCAVDQ